MKATPHVFVSDRVSRRDFLRLSSLVASMGGVMVLSGCGPAAQEPTTDDTEQTDAPADDAPETAALGDGVTLRVGMEAAYAPYNWQVSEESEYTIPIENVSGAFADGYDVQVAKRIAEGLGMEAVAVKLDFAALIDSLNNGQIDIVCAGMSVDPERAQSADFSDSYIDDDIVMITTKDSAYAGATTFADLAGASILGQAATMYDTVIDQIPDVNHMTPAETVPLVVQGLTNGTCDIITYSMLSVPKLLETYPDFVELQMDDKFEGSVMPDNAAIAKGQDAVLDQINEIIATIPEDERQQTWNDCMDRQPA
ncbi:transporter substrate-binding domain-containing protein [Thermophilibacter provencensis]|uniref:Transporter substrate-binding domain-containing protein n=1 Tax=Thermophilibacter provencensis TaxID=1852386 RepID=A0ABT7V263_9ACTN|nr:transporter substrate-binding domain-containing protein [Thermophilibacter provencensis]MDM8270689.1 transporter substrate-binding domain-containing protein [Thermophilibacter provencensis]